MSLYIRQKTRATEPSSFGEFAGESERLLGREERTQGSCPRRSVSTSGERVYRAGRAQRPKDNTHLVRTIALSILTIGCAALAGLGLGLPIHLCFNTKASMFFTSTMLPILCAQGALLFITYKAGDWYKNDHRDWKDFAKELKWPIIVAVSSIVGGLLIAGCAQLNVLESIGEIVGITLLNLAPVGAVAYYKYFKKDNPEAEDEQEEYHIDERRHFQAEPSWAKDVSTANLRTALAKKINREQLPSTWNLLTEDQVRDALMARLQNEQLRDQASCQPAAGRDESSCPYQPLV